MKREARHLPAEVRGMSHPESSVEVEERHHTPLQFTEHLSISMPITREEKGVSIDDEITKDVATIEGRYYMVEEARYFVLTEKNTYREQVKQPDGSILEIPSKEVDFTEQEGLPPVYVFEEGVLERVSDPDVLEKITPMYISDKKVIKAREERMKDELETVGVDPEIQEFLEENDLHEELNDRTSFIQFGVAFYRVGLNSSHEFYIGKLDGQRYVYTVGESWDTVQNPYHVSDDNFFHKEPSMEKTIRQVDSFGDAYLGHR